MADREYTVLFPFCGLGAGALGFLDAQVTMFGRPARFRSIGGIDIDRLACADFEYLTKTPALAADVGKMTVEQLRSFAGRSAPDVVFLSPPCKGFSGLLSKKAARAAKYRRLNRLVLDWIKLMLAAWPIPPRLVLLENVPRIASRGRRLLRAVKAHLRKAGYLFTAATHDCGELGGLAQHRQRFLLVARHQERVPGLLYQPITKRVRACGEVLEKLPMPGDPSAGPLHELPAISWINWVRLSLIPAGGDHRDLAGVLDGQPRRTVHRRHHVEPWTEPSVTVAGSGSNGPCAVADPRATAGDQASFESAKQEAPARGGLEVQPGNAAAHENKLRVEPWEAPAHTVTGATRVGSGAPSVADPRLDAGPYFPNAYGVLGWEEPSGVVTGDPSVTGGRFSVADPRFGHVDRVVSWEAAAGTVTTSPAPSSGAIAVADPRPFGNRDRVAAWGAPTGTVTSKVSPPAGGLAVADPRLRYYRGTLGVIPWGDPAGTVTSNGRPGSGRFAVADPRPLREPYDHAYAVLHPSEPSPTVAGKSYVGCGAYAFADARIDCALRAGAYGVLDWNEAAKTVTGQARIDNGPFAIADVREPAAPVVVALVDDPRKPPFVLEGKRRRPVAIVIRSEDGTWHRPLTTLELAALQGIPTVVDERPLELAVRPGRSAGARAHTAWRERIGNAVPPPTARAIAEQMLICLCSADAGSFALSSGGGVWVEPAVVAQ